MYYFTTFVVNLPTKVHTYIMENTYIFYNHYEKLRNFNNTRMKYDIPNIVYLNHIINGQIIMEP